MKLNSVLCVAGIVIGTAACGEGPRSAEQDELMPESGLSDQIGTTGAGEPEQGGLAAGETATGGEELPATASPLPLAGLVGLLSLGGATALRALRRRRDAEHRDR
jgi:hypothetical protein